MSCYHQNEKKIMSWLLSDIPDMSGKDVIVTGGNAGLGFKSCLELARRGARVTIACRSVQKGQIAADKIKMEIEDAQVEVLPLDLLDVASIRSFGEKYRAKHNKVDVLLNNAGVVNLDKHYIVDGGHEMHMATNHFGHFALTGVLWPLILSTPHARVVIVSSLAYKQGAINFDDLAWKKRPYNRMKCYGDSKLANLLFMNSLNRLFREKGVSAMSVAAHPGLTGTDRQQTEGIGGVLSKWIASPVEKGCRPQLMASCSEEVKAGDFYGPQFGILGPPKALALTAAATDEQVADRLWETSEKATGIVFD